MNIWQDLLFGARMLCKKPGFTLIAVLTLALGIGATTAIFSFVNAVLLQSLRYREVDRLVAVSLNDNNGAFGNNGYATFVDWQARAQSFAQLALIRSWGGTLTGAGEPEAVRGLRVTPKYFKLLGVASALGREFRAEVNAIAATLQQEHPTEYSAGTAVVFGLQDEFVSADLGRHRVLACWIPARRATKVDPMIALRCE